MRKNIHNLIISCLLLLPAGCTQERLEPQWQLEGDWARIEEKNYCSEFIRFHDGYCEKWESVKTFKWGTNTYRYFYPFDDHKIWGSKQQDWKMSKRQRYTLSGGTLSLSGEIPWNGRFVEDTLWLTGKSGDEQKYLRLKEKTSAQISSIILEKNTLSVGPEASVQHIGYRLGNPLAGWDDSYFYSIKDMGASAQTYDFEIDDSTIDFQFEKNPSSKTQKTQLWLYLAQVYDRFGGKGERMVGVASDSVAITITQSGQPVQSLSLDKSELSLKVGETRKLTATVSPSDADVLWSSDAPSVASVDVSGQVRARSVGTTVVTAKTAGDEKSASCTVTIEKGVPTFSIALTSLDVALQDTGLITITSNSDCVFTASSSNPSVATVSVSGKTVTVTGISEGTATVTVNCPATANYEAASSLTCSVVVYYRMAFDSPANCYIVSSPGTYSFKTVKGNSTASVGSVSKAEVLWESFGTSTAPSKGDIIKSVSYSGGNITFSTPATLKNGNAVIAAKDASGNILWSWHIWVCSGYDPVASAQTYYNNAGKMMDRNLGATSATPGSVGALGLLYQWGRKDPFLGSSSISSSTKANFTLSWPSPVSSSSSNGTIAYATAHPTTFIKGASGTSYDWVYSSRYNTLWQSSKTIYDPCPPGWKVPPGGSSGIWSKAVGSSSSSSYSWNSTNKGMNFSGKFGSASTIWYPASGYLKGGDGGLYNVGNYGYWWSCTPSGSYAFSLDLSHDGDVYPSDGYRAYGRSVRCLQE